MPIQSWQSNPNLSSTLEADNPKNLKLIFPPKLHSPLLLQRSSSLGNNPNCPDDFEHFYTPRATFKTNEKSVVSQIVHSSENATERLSKTFEIAKRKSKLSTSRRKKHEKYLRRFGTSSPFKHHDARELLRSAKRRLKKITEDQDSHLFGRNQRLRDSQSSLNGETRVQFALSQTPPVETASTVAASPPRLPNGANTSNTATHHTLSPVIQCFQKDQHRGELDLSEKYNYDLSKAQLKASSRTSALLAGFAMVCLVELQYDQNTSKPLLIVLGVVTSLLVSVHLLALMMSTCILPYMEATGCTQDSPHLKLKFYIDLSWLFSTCIGLLLFLVEIGVIFYVKFTAVGYPAAGYMTTAILVPVGIVFVVFSYLIHKNRVSHSLGRFKDKVDTMKQFLDVEASLQKSTIAPSTIRDI